MSLFARFPSRQVDRLEAWDDIVFMREVLFDKLKAFFSSRGVTPASPLMQELRDIRRATYEQACEAAMGRNVFEVARMYHVASMDVNKEVPAFRTYQTVDVCSCRHSHAHILSVIRRCCHSNTPASIER
jgi:hypothetical protein